MKTKLTLIALFFTLCACGTGQHFTVSVHRPGVGKVNTQVRSWGYDCPTYPMRTYTSKYMQRRQYNFKPKK